ncbi:erythromycin esterase family protein [Paenibacillus albiflavus]|uniref:Erythromycin esterase family protein n=1 Tax=Paenibacillus albiflavus TaxID=2545760 RepID=A0A4R4ELY0_9BACL|nr:erythromycin esterase family protein [Paenibacillus albiflavus]TCZ79328.1 erythromycin esterase family protein [Paenibacillus albiflavus]
MRRFILALMAVISILLTACSSQPNELTNELEKYAVPVNQLTIPKGVQIIALGEASHNNAEFQSVRLDVVKVLVEKYGVRTFILEEDFSNSELMNRYISGEDIELQDAWKDWFPLYHTQEMAALFNWMREYNRSASSEEQLQYWGMDVQNTYLILPSLGKYLQHVDSDLYKEFSSIQVSGVDLFALHGRLVGDVILPDRDRALAATDYIQDQQQWSSLVQKDVRLIEQLIHKMNMNADHLISKSSKQSYEVAMQNARSIYVNYSMINDFLLQDYKEGNGYLHFMSGMNNRDAAMKEKVDWILNQVNGPILIAGHNGHISKKNKTAGDIFVKAAIDRGISVDSNMLEFVTIGERLKKSYGDAYYAIGTSFNEGVLAAASSIISVNNPPTLAIRSDNIFLNSFMQLSEDVYFLDFDRAKQDKQLRRLISKNELRMPLIGSIVVDNFDNPNDRNMDNFYIDMILDETFDALINFRKVNLYTPYMR